MKRTWIALSIGLLLFLAFTPRFLLYPDYRILSWLLYGLIFGLGPYLIFKTVDTLDIKTNKGQWRIGLAFLTPLILGPSFGLFHQYRENKELNKIGVWTTAIVVDVKPTKRKNLIKCKYKVEGRTLETDYKTDWDDKYIVGDTIKIIYSADFPKIYELEYDWNKK
jgi:hypothetical protein